MAKFIEVPKERLEGLKRLESIRFPLGGLAGIEPSEQVRVCLEQEVLERLHVQQRRPLRETLRVR